MPMGRADRTIFLRVKAFNTMSSATGYPFPGVLGADAMAMLSVETVDDVFKTVSSVVSRSAPCVDSFSRFRRRHQEVQSYQTYKELLSFAFYLFERDTSMEDLASSLRKETFLTAEHIAVIVNRIGAVPPESRRSLLKPGVSRVEAFSYWQTDIGKEPAASQRTSVRVDMHDVEGNATARYLDAAVSEHSDVFHHISSSAISL
eukprot:ANDGO_01300.mRNA.1 hypothetical protein